jgi:hypothetical protein
MLAWQQRPDEEAHLFNPAFCCFLITKSVEDFAKQTKHGLVLPLAFLVLPVVLHKDTRHALPGKTTTQMLAWIQDHPERLIGFAERSQRMRLITKEALMFGLAHGFLAIGTDATLVVGPKRVSTTNEVFAQSTDEVRECLDRARFFGRWLAGAGTPGTIMASWGVAP